MNILNNIDKYFKEKDSKKEFVYTILSIVFALGFIIYYYIFPAINSFDVKAHKTYKKLKSDLQQEKIELNVLKAQDRQLRKSLKILKAKLKNVKKEKIFFDEITNLMDFAEFNMANWSSFVKDIIQNAKNEGLKVKLVENKIYNENDQKEGSNILVKKMSIALELKGNYINFLHFIYGYENKKELIRIEEMKIKNRNDYYVKFTVYGYGK